LFGKTKFPELPLHSSKIERFTADKIPAAILDARGYRDLLEQMLFVGEKAIAEFNVVRTKNNL
jgi:hypothetical protein